MRLDIQTKWLIAVGASVAANCLPCLEHTAGEAMRAGADAIAIAEAIEVAKTVRHGAASKMDELAAKLNGSTALLGKCVDSEQRGCSC